MRRLNISHVWSIQLRTVLTTKVTLERRRDHLISLALLRRHIARASHSSAYIVREFEIVSADVVVPSIRWILLVEDHPASAKLARNILEAEGYAVVVAKTAAEAAWQLEIAPPDAVVLDLRLPDRCGLALVRELRADPRTSTLPIVILTACAMVGDRERGLDAGCDEYLMKPLDAATLRATIARIAPQCA